jgi:hypothetical protein
MRLFGRPRLKMLNAAGHPIATGSERAPGCLGVQEVATLEASDTDSNRHLLGTDTRPLCVPDRTGQLRCWRQPLEPFRGLATGLLLPAEAGTAGSLAVIRSAASTGAEGTSRPRITGVALLLADSSRSERAQPRLGATALVLAPARAGLSQWRHKSGPPGPVQTIATPRSGSSGPARPGDRVRPGGGASRRRAGADALQIASVQVIGVGVVASDENQRRGVEPG